MGAKLPQDSEITSLGGREKSLPARNDMKNGMCPDLTDLTIYRFKMNSDQLLKNLKTKVIGKRILCYNVVDSTNKIALELSRHNLPEGTVVVAQGQDKGRGRLGRRWVSPRGTGIYLSIILRPKISLDKAAIITLMAAVSAAKTVRNLFGLPAQIRWPNDVLINNKKFCGVLIQAQANGHNIKALVLGIGVNVNTPGAKLPAGATSLRKELKARPLSRIKLTQALLRRLDRDYRNFLKKGPQDIISRWRELSLLSGKRVKLQMPDHKHIEGLARGIDAQGALVIQFANGRRQHVTAGEIIRIR